MDSVCYTASWVYCMSGIQESLKFQVFIKTDCEVDTEVDSKDKLTRLVDERNIREIRNFLIDRRLGRPKMQKYTELANWYL